MSKLRTTNDSTKNVFNKKEQQYLYLISIGSKVTGALHTPFIITAILLIAFGFDKLRFAIFILDFSFHFLSKKMYFTTHF